MKKEISKPAVYGIVAVVVALAVFVFMKFGTGSAPEFQAPPTSKVIPQYVWDSMDPSMRSKMESEGYKVGDVQPPQAAPSGAPGGVPLGGPGK